MCPYCVVRGRQACGGSPRGVMPAVTKIPKPEQMRASLVVHDSRRWPHSSRRPERKPSVNSTDGADCGSPVMRGSTQLARSWRPNAMASIQEVQLTGGGHCRQPLARPQRGRPAEYTRQTVVETMPYAK